MNDYSVGERIALVGLGVAYVVILSMLLWHKADSDNQRLKVQVLEAENELLREKVALQEELIEEYKYQEWYELHCTLSMIECVK